MIVQLVRGGRDTSTRLSVEPAAILAARFARGEIDAAEYRERLDVLSGRGGQAA